VNRPHQPGSDRPIPRHRRDRERGAVSAEVVIAVPALLVMVLAVVQFAVVAHARHIAQAVAAHALATARVDGGTAAAGRSAAEQLAAQLGPTLVDPVVDVVRGPERVTVTVTGTAQTVLPPLALTVTVTDDGPVERPLPATPAGNG
jgi:Flp pilus assembly protein TadG